jgi:thymidylate synthase (FAD)
MEVRLVAVTPNPEQTIARAYGICTGRDAIPLEAISKWAERGHLSPIEHATATFEISGISRACSHQLVRHRVASYSQESQRYVDMSDPQFVVPAQIASDPKAVKIWRRTVDRLRTAYRELRELGIRKEDARFLLPNATTTRIVMTANFREFLHMFSLRISPAAQWEIREVCVQMLELLYPIAPNIFGSARQELGAQYPSLLRGKV